MRLRLTLWFVVGVALLAIAGVAVTYTLLARQLQADLDDKLAQQLSLFGRAVSSADGPEALVVLTRRYLEGEGAENLRRNGVILALQTTDGTVVASVGDVALERLPEAAGLLLTGERVLTTVDTPAGPYRLAGTSVSVEDTRIASVEVGVSLSGLRSTLRRVLILVTGGAAAGTVAVGYGSWVLVGRALDPVRRITRTASAISRKDLSRRIAYSGPDDEIGELAATMDAMLDRLQEAFKAQESFITDVSHELRTPLTIAKGHLQVLDREDSFDPEVVRREHRLVLEEIDRMNRLVGDLLTLARATRVDFLRKEPVDLDGLLGMLVEQGPHLADRRWRLDELPGGIALVDQDRLIQVFLNLMHNAVAHTDPGDVIALGGRWDRLGQTTPVVRGPAPVSRRVELWVRDEGAGMAADVRARIFDRFYRGPEKLGGAPDAGGWTPGATPADPGATPAPDFDKIPTPDVGSAPAADAPIDQHLGLGLAIVAALVRAHEGRIALESAVGVGSRFTVTLPG